MLLLLYRTIMCCWSQVSGNGRVMASSVWPVGVCRQRKARYHLGRFVTSLGDTSPSTERRTGENTFCKNLNNKYLLSLDIDSYMAS